MLQFTNFFENQPVVFLWSCWQPNQQKATKAFHFNNARWQNSTLGLPGSPISLQTPIKLTTSKRQCLAATSRPTVPQWLCCRVIYELHWRTRQRHSGVIALGSEGLRRSGQIESVQAGRILTSRSAGKNEVTAHDSNCDRGQRWWLMTPTNLVIFIFSFKEQKASNLT